MWARTRQYESRQCATPARCWSRSPPACSSASERPWTNGFDTLFAIKELQEEYGHIQEVIIQNFRAKPDTRMRAHGEPSAVDMAVTIALARLILGPEMNIQAPPNLTADAYQFYLASGINDWGGVSPVTKDFINPEKAWPMITELKESTESLGYELKERLAIYPEYIVDKPGYLNPVMEAAVRGFHRRGWLRKG